MQFYDDSEIINPITKLIREYKKLELEEEIKYELYKKNKKKKKKNYKLFKIICPYIVIFFSISAFKMSAVYDIVNLSMQLNTLKSEIFENEKMINSLRYSETTPVDLNTVRNKSKKMGFTDEKKVTYIYFK